ncbi:unnamed protein product, partial [Meganyctiphanes norvegica]
GRTNKPFQTRMKEHQNNIVKKTQASALVRHIESHPGHEFDFDNASLIWKSNNKLETQILESACINTLPSCNVSQGDVYVGSTLSSVIVKIANLQDRTKARHNRNQQRPPQLYIPAPAIPQHTPILQPSPPHPSSQPSLQSSQPTPATPSPQSTPSRSA